MNATSSRYILTSMSDNLRFKFRAHTIVKIQFVQKTPKGDGNGTTTKTSEINLVDLAGRFIICM